MGAEGQRVRFRDCACPGGPHDGMEGRDDGDWVEMKPALSFTAGAEALRMMASALVVVSPSGGGPDGTDPVIDNSRADGLVGPVYVREGVKSWNVVDEDGVAVPLDVDLILSNYGWAYPIAEAGDDLYSGALLAPLLKRTSGQSGNGRTVGSTPPPRRSSSMPPQQRKRSSPNGSAGQPSAPIR